jgi:hypothetical protein
LTFSVDQEFSEVPFDVVVESSWLLLFEEGEERMRIRSIHVNLRIEIGLELESSVNEFFDVGIAAWFLEKRNGLVKKKRTQTCSPN